MLGKYFSVILATALLCNSTFAVDARNEKNSLVVSQQN